MIHQMSLACPTTRSQGHEPGQQQPDSAPAAGGLEVEEDEDDSLLDKFKKFDEYALKDELKAVVKAEVRAELERLELPELRELAREKGVAEAAVRPLDAAAPDDMLESMQPSLTPGASACLCVYARPAASAAAAFDDCFDDGLLPPLRTPDGDGRRR